MRKLIEDVNLFENAKVVLDLRRDDKEKSEFIKERRKTIGGSEIPKIAGESEWGSPLTVYNEKFEIGEKFLGNSHTIYGNRMKKFIKEWIEEDFEEREKIGILIYEYPFMMVDKTQEYFSGNIDALAVVSEDYKYYENRENGEIRYIPKGELFGIQIKTCSDFQRSKWKEGVPREYMLQCQWYMGITEMNYFLMIYLIGSEVNWRVIVKNEEEIKSLREIGKSFFENHIIKKVAPSPSGLKMETEAILSTQMVVDEDEVEIKDNKIKRVKEIDEFMKEFKRERDRLKQDIIIDMGNSKKATDGEFFVRRCVTKRVVIDVEQLKKKYPKAYKDTLKSSNEYLNMRIGKVE